MIFTKLTLGNGSSMAQIVEGEFQLIDVPCIDSERTVPMFIGVRVRVTFDDHGGKHKRESRIAIPVGAVTFAEFSDGEEDESLDLPDELNVPRDPSQ